MADIFFTLGIAFGVIVIAVVLLGIGWIITGKPRLRGGMCGRVPDKKGTCNPHSTCGVCGKSEKEADKKEDS